MTFEVAAAMDASAGTRATVVPTVGRLVTDCFKKNSDCRASHRVPLGCERTDAPRQMLTIRVSWSLRVENRCRHRCGSWLPGGEVGLVRTLTIRAGENMS